jgi:hypothetical protein
MHASWGVPRSVVLANGARERNLDEVVRGADATTEPRNLGAEGALPGQPHDRAALDVDPRCLPCSAFSRLKAAAA